MTGLKPCLSCKKEVAKHASKCPHCGQGWPGQGDGKVGFYIFIAIIVFIVGYYVVGAIFKLF